jgi:hypothetical protein
MLDSRRNRVYQPQHLPPFDRHQPNISICMTGKSALIYRQN